MYRNFLSMLLCLPILAFTLAATAQETFPKAGVGAVPPAAEPPTPSGANRRVTIDVTVTDSRRMPVAGLSRQDFTLLDNKKPVNIVSFEAFGSAQTPARPDEVILVVDAVNLKFLYVAYTRQELEKFFRQNEGRLDEPLSIFVTSDTGVSGMRAPSTNGNAVADALDRFQGGLRLVGRSAGVYGAGERFEMSVRMFMSIVQIAARQPGRKLIVWIGRGWPMLGGPGFDSPSEGLQRQYFAAIVRLSTVMRQNKITLDSISAGLPDSFTFLYQSYLKGVKSPRYADSANLDEKVIAVQSGGIVLPPQFNLPGDIQKCIDDASVFYRLSFDAPPAEKPNEYHALGVKIAGRGLKALTNTGYYDEP
ncbi:MAG: VWA domain-containing protein [Terracidiphilus sp.]